MDDKVQEGQLKSSIAKALLYSDIFSYPLTAKEVFLRLSTNHTCVEEVTQMLERMKRSDIVFQFGEFFSIRNESNLEMRRLQGNRCAMNIMPGALRRGRLLASFPFIRAVMISGSLSKNYMDHDSDVDYFVITAPGRLWIARLLVAVFKRIFLLNSRKRFCVNYYVDQHHLEIEEKNIFTATELVTLIPVSGGPDFDRLIESNSWVRDYFPNYNHSSGIISPLKVSWLKRLTESLFNPAGDFLDSYILRFAARRNKKRYSHLFSDADFKIALKSRKGVSKTHNNFQRHVTELFERKVLRFHQDHGQTVVT